MITINWIEAIGYCGTIATIATYSMKTIVPLRIAGIASSVFFISYSTILGVWPMLATELVILPLNCLRLYQILRLMNQIRDTPDGRYLPEWLQPFSRRRRHKAGDVVFRLGESADYLLLIESGRYRLVESDIVMAPGQLVGEIGFVSHDHLRTMTLTCIEEGSVGEVSYSDIRQLYFQNPRFGYFFLQLLGSHLVDKLQLARGELREARHAADPAFVSVAPADPPLPASAVRPQLVAK